MLHILNTMIAMILFFQIASVIAVVVMVAVVGWLFSILLKDSSLADVYWGIYFILIAVVLYFQSPVHNSIQNIDLILIILWGTRLAIHIALRKVNKPEDFRYSNWRNQWGKNFLWKNLLQNYLLQALFAIIISSSTLVIFFNQDSASTIHWWQYIAILIWIKGFIYEFISDHQLTRFMKLRKSNKEVLKSGLWKYSRHPNYFGEIVQWLGLWILTIGLKYYLFAIISPLLISYLIVFVSGIPLLEKRFSNNPDYKEYMRYTPSLIPFFKRKSIL